ncbi:MAG: lysophospholipid acyltransferase family protein [Muribaculaceae bacterium]|nr:lysophospholipid acyltransferase family protein [Muribaculaceae bacterium]
MGELKHDKWVGTTYGNDFMHNWLIKGLKVIDVRLLYAFTYLFVVPPTLLINSRSRNIIYRYFRERLGFGRLKSAWMTIRNHWDFSEVVIDRFAMYAGKEFKIDIDNFELFKRLSQGEKGFIQLSSHIGNYELAGYSLPAKDKRLNALVFGGEKESVMANRNKMFEGHNIRMIPMSPDMSHIFEIDAALTQGEILSMPADRVFGSQKSFDVKILGKTAHIPQGPFLLGATRGVPVLFTTVMKSGAVKYHITIREVTRDESKSVREQAREMAEHFASLLEDTLLQYPTQWYNYFEFWS